MKIQKIIFALAFVSFLAIGCKNEAKKENTPKVEKTAAVVDKKDISLNISGMTCEIGCARKIASDLSKKEGVLEANVIFKDSIANIKYDANITNKADLISFIQGIGNGKMYKACQVGAKSCKKNNTDKKACASKCKKECDSKTKGEHKICKADCQKQCSSKDAHKKACSSTCKKECCTKNEADKKICSTECKKECCTKDA
ncbi:heavy metal-associated domain-containing protein [Tenacibaculum pacificus]|uniref:cation transporter n=1 Tax=Tenacibaculum pacificus TaxID=3018314 RepID=UPI0022F3A0B6|nr:heavy metal-associated domain-containing protein [Tenacibaculum pacificus]WBX73772.1 heavy metal-associated domain-containing protein [Tenacibaculum pacificus]